MEKKDFGSMSLIGGVWKILYYSTLHSLTHSLTDTDAIGTNHNQTRVVHMKAQHCGMEGLLVDPSVTRS